MTLDGVPSVGRLAVVRIEKPARTGRVSVFIIVVLSVDTNGMLGFAVCGCLSALRTRQTCQ